MHSRELYPFVLASQRVCERLKCPFITLANSRGLGPTVVPMRWLAEPGSASRKPCW
jgi:hypothetical protein